MSNQEKSKVVSEQGKYEYAFEAVPDSERKSGWGMFLVLAGYPIAVSNFVTGAAIGYQMTFADALLSIIVGDAFLIFIAVSTGIISFETGLSTSFLSRTVFGRKGSAIFSLLLVMSSITWIGINGDTFAQMVIANFPGCLVVFVLMGVSYGGYGVVLSYEPDPASTMSFAEAAASIVGSWVFGCLITPDVCRFGRSKRDVVAAGIGAFTVGLFCLQVVGVIVAQIARNGDFSAATAAIGLGFLVMACTLVCLCTTQDNNIYGAGLAAQNVLDATRLRGRVTHSQIAFVVTALAAAFAACGALQWLLPIIQFLSVLMAPIPAMMVAERYLVRRSKLRVEVNPTAIACWLLGGVVGQACLSAEFFVSPIVSYAATVVFYVVLSRLFDKRVLGHLADGQVSAKA